jgi:sugar lactone lactonase YvrE
MQGSFPDPGGNTLVAPGGVVSVIPNVNAARNQAIATCQGDIAKFCSGQTGFGATGCLKTNNDKLGGACKEALAAVPAAPGDAVPGCIHSTICGHIGGGTRPPRQRVEWAQNLGYTFTYPYNLPQGTGGVPSVALDSKGDLWAFKRSPVGTPQLYEFSPDYKIIRTVGDDVIGHADKAHGMAIDAHDNVWICDTALATVKEISPDGKLLRTFGVSGKRGDWDESKGQRLLWQPVMLAFGPKGDIYIGEGHANESPNDVDSPDPANVIGAARIIHLDANGNFVNQWLGDEMGQGKFDASHGLAVDPKTGDVWIGDREEYRIVIYTSDGKFLRTIQMRNLVCALQFDHEGNPWMASGQDGQFLKLTRDGKVIGAVGEGMGIGPHQFIEASYFVFDKNDNIYAGDTSVGRITKMVSPKRG